MTPGASATPAPTPAPTPASALSSSFDAAPLRPPSPSALKSTSRWFVYVIEVLHEDADEWKIAYCGCTNRDAIERMLEHEHQSSGAVRVAASTGAFGLGVHRMRVMAVLNVPDENKKAAFALESYLMMKHETIVPRYKRLWDLFAYENRESKFPQPDIQLPGRPRNFQLNCKRSTSDNEAIGKARAFFDEACASTTICQYKEGEQEELMDGIDKLLGLDEPLPRFIVPCAREEVDLPDDAKRVEFVIDSSFMKARDLRLKYESIDGWEEVNPDEIIVDLDSVAAFEDGDTQITAQIKRLKVSVHSDHRKHTRPSAVEAASLFKSLEHFTGSVMEGQLDLEQDAEIKADLSRARRWRDWVRSHDGLLPREKPNPNVGTLEEQRREKSTRNEMKDWKKMYGTGCKQRNRNVFLLVMRHFDAFADFLVPLSQITLDRDKQTNEWLKQEYGVECERREYVSSSGEEFPGLDLKPFPYNGPDGKKSTHYGAWKDYLMGAKPTSEEHLLTGLPTGRAAKARAIHSDNFERRRESMSAAALRQKELQRSSGITRAVHGKRKLELV